MRTTATGLEELPTALESGHSKIRDFDVLLRVEEEVLRLEISVADVEAVAVIDTRDDLLEVVQRFVGVKFASRDEVVE